MGQRWSHKELKLNKAQRYKFFFYTETKFRFFFFCSRNILQFIELGSGGKCFLENWRKKIEENKKRTDSWNWKQCKPKVTKSKSVTKGLSQGELGSSKLSGASPYFLGASEEWSCRQILLVKKPVLPMKLQFSDGAFL